MQARTTGQVANAMTQLRDVNRCRVRPTDLIVHQGYAVLVTDLQGWIGTGLEGFYLHQTRFLSRFDIAVGGAEPKSVSANVVDHHFLTAYHLASSPAGRPAEPDREKAGPGGSEVVSKGVELQMNAFAGGGLHIDVVLTNHALAPADIDLTLNLAADFADYNEALAGKRKQDGFVERNWHEAADGGELLLRYKHPKLDLASSIKLTGTGRVIDLGHALACRLSLPPQVPHVLSLDLSPHFLGTVHAPFYGRDGTFSSATRPALARRSWTDGCEQIEADNPLVQTAWDQAVSDLASLQVLEGPDSQPFMIVAGMPNYTGLFGRDAFLTALQSSALVSGGEKARISGASVPERDRFPMAGE